MRKTLDNSPFPHVIIYVNYHKQLSRSSSRKQKASKLCLTPAIRPSAFANCFRPCRTAFRLDRQPSFEPAFGLLHEHSAERQLDENRPRRPRLHHGRHCAQRRVLPAFESGGAQKTARNRINREKAEVMRLRFVFWFLHPAASPPPLGARCALNSLIFRQCDPRDRRSHPPVRQGRSRWRHVRQGP